MTKKQKVLDAAIELFAKQGIESTTIQQITVYSGISKGAFYLSFSSKDALILEMIDYFMKSITANIDHLVNEAKQEKLTVYFEATFTSLAMYTTKAYLTHPVNTGMRTDSFTKAQICEELVQVAQLDLSPLATEKPRIALLTGMLANFEEEPKMGWCCYILRRYIKEQQALLSV